MNIEEYGFFGLLLQHEADFINIARANGIKSLKIEININAACSACIININMAKQSSAVLE